MTSVSSPLAPNPNGPTVLIGYDPNLQMLAGFDLARHRTFTQGSPSVQIDIRVVQQAQQDGLAFDRKDNRELAIGIRPDQFLTYINNAAALHRQGADAQTFEPLTTAAAAPRLTRDEEEELDRQLSGLTQPRRQLVQEVRRLSRLAAFRRQVLFAYGSQCAVTRAQLRLVDAAHILPVGAPGSIDHVCNGIALAPTYHRAYDNGLIFLDEAYEMRINDEKVQALRAQSLIGGLVAFRQPLGRIFLPPDRNQWPTLALIRKANAFRQITV
jgi:putative restriction endonuclease